MIKNSMNILFLFVSLPNLSSEGGLFPSLIHEFVKHGHKVFVSSKGKGISKSEIREEGGVPVLRIKCPEFTGVSNNVKKAIAYQQYVIKQRHLIKKYWNNEKIDLIVSHSLPPELAFIIGGLKSYFRCQFYLIQSDYTWQDAVGLGFFSEKSIVARYYKFWEKRMISIADFIGCPTNGNISFLKKYYPSIDDSKFDILPFWMNEQHVTPNYELRREFGWDEKFVVIYGGSVGAAQRVDHVIELAETCKSYEDIVFVILGKGVMLGQIKLMAAIKGLSNVAFKDFLPQDQYLSFLAACDVGLIILNESLGTPNFPSKSLSYLNMKVPILAALDYVTDFGFYLEENKAGLWAHSDRIDDLKEKLLLYYEDKELRNRIKENGYRLFKKQLTAEVAYQTIINRVNNNKL